MIDPEREAARRRDRELRDVIDPAVDQLSIVARVELVARIMATIVQDSAHELRSAFADDGARALNRSGEREEARKPLPIPTLELPSGGTTTHDNTEE